MCHTQLHDRPDDRFVGPVDVWLTFRFDRPRHHYGTGRNANLLKPAAPTYPRTGGDLDKLMRAVADALGRKHGAGVIADDADIVTFNAAKRYATPLAPVGCDITITQAGRTQ
jgi:crossover junction endodeoxyribonuclease RusA